MLKPVCYKTDEERGYQQALDDFGIAELLAKLSDYCEQPEQETLAAVLIYQLTQSIDAELIANYLGVIRYAPLEAKRSRSIISTYFQD
ncbi:hypothetical protein [Nostoc sp.]|uniref:hypothetical protein n=1 Tax=Nostoc sp. TaxID=1180 RepID=UPI002FFB4242